MIKAGKFLVNLIIHRPVFGVWFIYRLEVDLLREAFKGQPQPAIRLDTDTNADLYPEAPRSTARRKGPFPMGHFYFNTGSFNWVMTSTQMTISPRVSISAGVNEPSGLFIASMI